MAAADAPEGPSDILASAEEGPAPDSAGAQLETEVAAEDVAAVEGVLGKPVRVVAETSPQTVVSTDGGPEAAPRATEAPSLKTQVETEEKEVADSAPVHSRPVGTRPSPSAEPAANVSPTDARVANPARALDAEAASSESVLSKAPGAATSASKPESVHVEPEVVAALPPVEKSEDVAPRTPVPPILSAPPGAKNEESPAETVQAEATQPQVQRSRRAEGWGVELGTFQTQADADLAWLRLQAREQTLFAGLNRRIENGGGSIRLMAGSVRSRAQARAICQALQTSQSDCAPREF